MSSVHFHAAEYYRNFTQHRIGTEEPYYAYKQEIKRSTRLGSNDEINIWIVEKIGEYTCGQDGYGWTGGYCRFPSSLNELNHEEDGCVIIMDTLPTVKHLAPFEDHGDGSTLIHEIGHWFGLSHIFADGKDCTGASDTAEDTFRFPNEYKWEPNQPLCCKKPGSAVEYEFCPDGRKYHVSNLMSYSPDRGKPIAGDLAGAESWTNDQRKEMFVNFYTFRRPQLKMNVDLVKDCFSYPVYIDPNHSSGTSKRSVPRVDFGQRTISIAPKDLRSESSTKETLRRLCHAPPVAGEYVDGYSGEIMNCTSTTCTPPTSVLVLRCPDGSAAPCNITANSGNIQVTCEDGSAPPCPQAPFCDAGEYLTCMPSIRCPDGTAPPCRNPPVPPVPPVVNTQCPKACLPHQHQCDKTTAQDCKLYYFKI
ncbi:hypothetical protein DM02DRAFT_658790 [Periconia macrospinosa]|uniref:Peptidase M43 pregnancy-associated plasma-A domain-containing protein n=1 Tax=Periconia macrospinosa TaxID=97972 RepID=A0A2V1DFP1_9PLEO|nr:hypothetical protein DM02DRAFT_658790 [Periconia macrospinosa]